MPETRTVHPPEFWNHLIAANAFDESLLNEMKMAVRLSPWRPFGAILVELGYMRLGQVAHLLRIQADEMHMRIGALAVREGFCTTDQIENALAVQRERNVTPIDVLVADERVDQRRLMRGLARYIADLEAIASTAEAA